MNIITVLQSNPLARTLAFCLTSVIALASCGQSTTTQNPPDTSVQSTEWIWVQSEGGFRGGVVTPESAGYTQKYVLRSDSTLSFVRTPDPDNVTWNGAYQISQQFDPNTQDLQYQIRLYVPQDSQSLEYVRRLQYLGSDTILVGDNLADGVVETYVKMP